MPHKVCIFRGQNLKPDTTNRRVKMVPNMFPVYPLKEDVLFYFLYATTANTVLSITAKPAQTISAVAYRQDLSSNNICQHSRVSWLTAVLQFQIWKHSIVLHQHSRVSRLTAVLQFQIWKHFIVLHQHSLGGINSPSWLYKGSLRVLISLSKTFISLQTHHHVPYSTTNATCNLQCHQCRTRNNTFVKVKVSIKLITQQVNERF